MFKLAQPVRHKTRQIQGTVLEVDGDTVYIETDSRVEMQFTLSELEDNSVPLKPAGPVVEDPKYQRLLDMLPEGVVGMATVAYARSPSSARAGWTTAPARERVGWVAKVTGLSIEQLTTLATAGKGKQIEAHAAVAYKKVVGGR